MTETLHDRRDELSAFQITVMHGPTGDRFRVRIAENVFGTERPMQDYASGGAQNFKDALRQALHYVSPALASEVFPEYYVPAAAINLLMELDSVYPANRIKRLEAELEASRDEVRRLKFGRCKFSSACEFSHDVHDTTTQREGEVW